MKNRKVFVALAMSTLMVVGMAMAAPSFAEPERPSISDQIKQLQASGALNGVNVSPNVQVTQTFSGWANRPTYQDAFNLAVQGAVTSAVQAGYKSNECTVTKYVSYPIPVLPGSSNYTWNVTVFINCTKQM